MSERSDEVYNSLSKELATIESEINAIKNKQFIGTDSFVTYANVSGNEWDIDTTDTWVPPQLEQNRNYSIVFTADNQVAPFNVFSVLIYVNGQRIDIQDTMLLFGSTVFVSGWVHDYFLSYANSFPQPGKDGFYFAIRSGVSGTHIQVRITVYSSDTGTFTVTEIP